MIFILINGHPQSGKDTLIDITDNHFNVEYVSTIDQTVSIAKLMGWDGVKDNRSRKMLSDLKRFYAENFDGPFNDIIGSIEYLKDTETDVFFTISREGEEIERFRRWSKHNGIPFYYVFVAREGSNRVYGNVSDDEVLEVATPDIVIHNDKTLDVLENSVIEMINDILIHKPKKIYK